MSDKILSGKVAIITGASAGIGKAAALLFAKQGARVVIASRRKELNQETLDEVKSCGGEGLALSVDVSKESDIKMMVDETVKKFGRLDIAFNNAGVGDDMVAFLELTEDNYHHIFDINVKGVLFCMKYQIAQMLKNGGGSIINTSSIAGHMGMGIVPVYAASKHAVEGLTKSIAVQYARDNIRVNSVAPAAIETQMYREFVGNDAQKQEFLKNLHPIGRIGQPEEVAEAVLWLASNKSSFVTGHSLMVDGGYTVQ